MTNTMTADVADDPSAPSGADAGDPLPRASFADLGLPTQVVDSLARAGFDAPFAVQAEVLPPALQGQDVAAQAATGSGKTLAFVVPAVCLALERRGRSKRPPVMVLTPTRELAAQVADVAREVAGPLGLRVAACYGGTPIPKQERRLADGVDLLIATPGRLIDLHERGAVAFDDVALAVVDEADRMADMGFAPQVDWLLRRLPATRQTILCSATLAGDVARLSENWLDDPVVVGVEERSSAPGQLVHRFLYVHGADKDRVAARLIRSYGRCVVFCDTKRDTDRVARRLAALDVKVAALHGDLQQKMRERALDAFSEGKVEAIVATDVAARGLDVEGVACVIQYQPASDPTSYLHRVGRTARAGAIGLAVTLVEWDKEVLALALKRRLGMEQLPIVEVFSNDERLDDVAAWDMSAESSGPSARKRS
jgi:superfamily II DNA/RNA helicase